MNLKAAEALAKSLLSDLSKQYSILVRWNFKWNDRKRALGICSFRDRTIQLSRTWTEACDEAMVRDTILHEIAHVLAGPSENHGPVWKSFCRAIGANPQRYADVPEELLQAVRAQAKWHIVYAPVDHTQSVEKIKPMHRVGKSMFGCGIVGRPETKGQLYYLETKYLGTAGERKYLMKGSMAVDRW